VKRFLPGRGGAGHDAGMTTRRRLAAAALPLLAFAVAARGATGKSIGPAALEACRPGAPAAACAEAKDRLVADGGDLAAAGLCPHCVAAFRDRGGVIPGRTKLF